MTGIQILLIICFVILVTYMAMCCIRYGGVPESVSESSYIWEEDCTHSGNLHKANYFSLYCLLTAGLLFYPWIALTPESFGFLAFIGCAGILAAGSTPFFHEKFEGYIHYGGGIIAVICWIIWMCLMHYWFSLGIAFLCIGFLCLIRIKSYVLWAELVGLVTLMLKLFLLS